MLKRLFPGDEPARTLRPRLSNWIPDGWIGCPATGRSIAQLIPAEVPLGDDFRHHPLLAAGEHHFLRDVVTRLKLGLVIDLTNTTRYYESSCLTEQFRIDYLKIPCKGKDEAPDEKSVSRFVDEVSQFCERNTDPARHVLVHCTHGHNRTGFMIEHFLVRKRKIPATQAIEIFAKARPPGVYKTEYIAALHRSYGGPESFVCPRTPQWKKNTEQTDSEPKSGMTINNLLGDAAGSEQQEELRRVCCELLELPPGLREKLQFPGSHLVSLDRKSLTLLRPKY